MSQPWFSWGPPREVRGKAFVTFVVTPSWGGKTLQFALPFKVMRLLLVLAGVLVLGVIVAILGLGKVVLVAHSATRLAAENDSLKVQFARLEQLDREMQDMSAVDSKLRKLAGLDVYETQPARDGSDTPASPGQARKPQHHPGIWSFGAPNLAPRQGPISQGFHEAGVGDGAHPGIDIPGPLGAPICAAGNGIVSRVGVDSVYGNMVIISHGSGLESLYGHTSKVLVAQGDTVWAGDEIAEVGNSGRSSAPHLHFAVLRDGQAVDPSGFIRSWGKPKERSAR
jgi:murein DD-endopeptidase MepM/ murein hydrolase activator NlpD